MNERDSATRAETVGSLLRPEEVRRAVEGSAAAPSPGNGREPAAVAGDGRILDDAVLRAIDLQEQAGLDVITDGEMRRFAWVQTPRFLDCFEVREGAAVALSWRGGSQAPGSMPAAFPVVVRRVSDAKRLGSMTDEYAFLSRNAHTRTKYSMAAPSYHRRFWSAAHSKAAYRSCEGFLADVRDYQREVLAELIALGCDYIQLDAPNYGSLCDPDTRERMRADGRDPDAELAFDAELDSSLFDGIEGVEGVTRALHICRGNGPGGTWHSSGGYAAISSLLFPRLDFDRLLLEYDTDRAGDFGPLADVRAGTVAVLGLLTTKSGDLEDEGQVEARIAEAAHIKPLSELALSTQCGFASVAISTPLTPTQQQAKLELVARVAHRTWPTPPAT